jgi:hypothetical protein
MIDDIKNLVGCGDPDVEKQAAIVLELTESKENGDITAEEYEELLHDIANTNKIEDLAGDMKLKGALVTAIYGILQIV